MRIIESTGQFKRDYKRESKGLHRTDLDELLFPAIELLTNDLPLPGAHLLLGGGRYIGGWFV